MTEPEGAAKHKKPWYRTFVGWHRDDDKLWREIYARTVATLLAAFIAYLIAVMAGAADPAPLKLILLIGGIALLVSGAISLGFYLLRIPSFDAKHPARSTTKDFVEQGLVFAALGLVGASIGVALLTIYNPALPIGNLFTIGPVWPLLLFLSILYLTLMSFSMIRRRWRSRRQRAHNSSSREDT